MNGFKLTVFVLIAEFKLPYAGKTCRDPGTPAEATQVVTNYERDQVLYFICNRDGYEPYPKLNYTCNYNEATGTAEWSNNLANSLPECKDTTKPVIHNLPSGTIYKDIMDPVSLPVPYYTDNFGVRKTKATHPIRSGDVITRSLTVAYTAEDYDGNNATGDIVIEVIDRTNKPSLSCPPYLELPVNSSTTTIYNIRQHIVSDFTLQLSQELVTVSVNSIGYYYRIDVTAKNQFNTEAYCSFLVTFKATVCFQETLFLDSMAIRNCVGNNGTIICTSTCKSGYLYGDGTKQKVFSCSGPNEWAVNYPDVFCLPALSPAYQFRATVFHEIGYLANSCLTDYQSAIAERLNTYESQMSALTDCNGIQWDITSHTAGLGSGSTRFQSVFTVELKTTAVTEQKRSQCTEAIKTNKQVFNFANNLLYCTNAATNVAIVTANLNVTSGAFDCISSTHRLLENTEDGITCLPCGPGQFYAKIEGSCISCPDGQYQVSFDGVCNTCVSGQTNAQQTDCITTCPPGFVSDDGLFPCRACSADSFWSDSQTCSACPSRTSTSGREGVVSPSGCYASCAAGSYSRTGYNDRTCYLCPYNFYQPIEGQDSCIECPSNQVGIATGQTDGNSCYDYTFQADESCNNAYCNNHGTCSFGYHRPTCSCDEGFKGDRCETSFHICDSNYSPCMNGASCVPGDNYWQFTCMCSVGFGGAKCEKDLKDGCASETNQCSDEAMCKDTAAVLNGYECLCPSEGGYTGKYCDQTHLPCSSSPCKNNGFCQNFGNVRYECICSDGFTGTHCETNIGIFAPVGGAVAGIVLIAVIIIITCYVLRRKKRKKAWKDKNDAAIDLQNPQPSISNINSQPYLFDGLKPASLSPTRKPLETPDVTETKDEGNDHYIYLDDVESGLRQPVPDYINICHSDTGDKESVSRGAGKSDNPAYTKDSCDHHEYFPLQKDNGSDHHQYLALQQLNDPVE